jgi:hypothetical protein
MISVIVPTMWNYGPFLRFVNDIVQHPNVGEVIIIDNDFINMPWDNDYKHVLGHEKVKRFTPPGNIFVNPAWNFGASIASYDHLCFMNDDVIFDLKLFNRVDNMMSPEVGVVGICPGVEGAKQAPFKDGSIDIVPWALEPHDMFLGCRLGFGCLFFMHKDNWVDIPHEFRVYFGDDWVFDNQQLVYERPIHLITNCFFYTPYAATTAKMNLEKAYQREYELYLPLISQMQHQYYEKRNKANA